MRAIMHSKLAVYIVLLGHSLASAQTSNPGGPVQSLSSATDQSTSSILSIQTNTVVSNTGTTVSITSQSETGSTTTDIASSSSSPSSLSSSVSGAGAAVPQETGYALAVVAAGLIGAFAAL
ncbi:hypothetical protein F5B19DRAFT_439907 [Rostrohypoxylon terebratum]|nr:hypothetical protein F5B19DRAFT_439907 [Rostrohypoxylon terebratum]